MARELPAMKQVASAVGAALQKISGGPAPAQPELALNAPAPDANIGTPPEPDPKLNPRYQAMQDIIKRSNADADKEAMETMPTADEDGNVTPAATPTEPPAAEPPETPAVDVPPAGTPAAPAPTQEAAPEQFDPNKEYTLTVDGKQVKFKGAQIIESGTKALQKESAAEARLELATRMLLEARALTPQPPKPDAAKVEAPAELTDEQLAEVIQFGTKEQAAQAIKALRQPSKGAVTEESLMKFVREEAPKISADQIAFQGAVSFVQTEYGDLIADPYLKPLFFMKENEMRKAGDARPYKEMYQEIGEGIRTHFNRPKTAAAAPQAAAPQTRDAKVAAKAAAPAAPRLASARMEAAAEPKPLTASQIIEKQARLRGFGAPTQH